VSHGIEGRTWPKYPFWLPGLRFHPPDFHNQAYEMGTLKPGSNFRLSLPDSSGFSILVVVGFRCTAFPSSVSQPLSPISCLLSKLPLFSFGCRGASPVNFLHALVCLFLLSLSVSSHPTITLSGSNGSKLPGWVLRVYHGCAASSTLFPWASSSSLVRHGAFSRPEAN